MDTEQSPHAVGQSISSLCVSRSLRLSFAYDAFLACFFSCYRSACFALLLWCGGHPTTFAAHGGPPRHVPVKPQLLLLLLPTPMVQPARLRHHEHRREARLSSDTDAIIPPLCCPPRSTCLNVVKPPQHILRLSQSRALSHSAAPHRISCTAGTQLALVTTLCGTTSVLAHGGTYSAHSLRTCHLHFLLLGFPQEGRRLHQLLRRRCGHERPHCVWWLMPPSVILQPW